MVVVIIPLLLLNQLVLKVTVVDIHPHLKIEVHNTPLSSLMVDTQHLNNPMVAIITRTLLLKVILQLLNSNLMDKVILLLQVHLSNSLLMVAIVLIRLNLSLIMVLALVHILLHLSKDSKHLMVHHLNSNMVLYLLSKHLMVHLHSSNLMAHHHHNSSLMAHHQLNSHMVHLLFQKLSLLVVCPLV
jgi:hypothetical protein